ncbi:MAG: hypothetical protein KGZ67_09030 [Hydrogenophaga sp.]|jgi:hypothetical protein|nr:hypothetical protein [Hydrogenophaga sp.]
MATPLPTGLHWATAVCGHPRRPAPDAQSAALSEHLRHCRARAGRPAPATSVASQRLPVRPGRERLVALFARAARLIR